MSNNLERKVRKNFLKTTLFLPVLMGFVPERRRLQLQEIRINMLKSQSTALYPTNPRKAVFKMETALREEYKLNDRRRSLKIAKWLKEESQKEKPQPKKKYTQTQMAFVTKMKRTKINLAKNLSVPDLPFLEEYLKTELIIAIKLGLPGVITRAIEFMEKLKKAKPGEDINID